jgi:hypothetical protein
MIVKASGRSALLLATGLLVGFAGPSRAASDTDNTAASSEITAGAPIALSKYTKQSSHSSKKVASQKSGKVASKPSTGNKAAATDDAKTEGTVSSSEIPPWVANANAQWGANANAQLASADTSTSSSAKAMSARANTILQAGADNPANAQPAADSQVVSADQLNDVDRALQESKPAAPAMRMASAEAPATSAAPVTAGSGESSTWDQASLIGKIFIGFGALLTMASAARMFMA